jgi:hypothetical protein
VEDSTCCFFLNPWREFFFSVFINLYLQVVNILFSIRSHFCWYKYSNLTEQSLTAPHTTHIWNEGGCEVLSFSPYNWYLTYRVVNISLPKEPSFVGCTHVTKPHQTCKNIDLIFVCILRSVFWFFQYQCSHGEWWSSKFWLIKNKINYIYIYMKGKKLKVIIHFWATYLNHV